MFCNSKFYLSIFLLLIISCQSIDEFETSISPNNITEIEDNLYLLSLNGSSRATAYPNLNKIDNIGELFFISWLGIDKNIFKPNITYFNIKNKKFGKTFIIDKSFDNHGVPSILVDKKNRINMFYYPHSHHIKHAIGTFSNDSILSWDLKKSLGNYLTYPNPVYQKDSGILLFSRKTVNIPGPNPLVTYGFHTINKDNSSYRGLFRTNFSGYGAFSSFILSDNNKLSIASNFHENSFNDTYGNYQTISYVESFDGGFSWKKNALEDIKYKYIPSLRWKNLMLDNLITSSKSSIVYLGGIKKGNYLNIGGLQNNKFGEPQILFLKESIEESKIFIADRNHLNKSWGLKEISKKIFPLFENKRFSGPMGGYYLNNDLEIFPLIIQDDIILRDPNLISAWGHKSNAVVLVISDESSGNFKILRKFNGNKKGIWLPYLKVIGNDGFLMFTLGNSKDNPKNYNTNKTKVFLFHFKLSNLKEMKYKNINL